MLKIKRAYNFVFHPTGVFILVLILLSIPMFWRMLRPGIYTMQDPVHLLRLVDYSKCIEDWQIPCRWSPSSGLGYGEPVFNFYGQLPYLAGGLFHLIGFSFIDSLKILFILSLVGSGISMFFLARHLWKNNWAALISSLIYVYAPYRAVDVWVRGALPEAFAFVLFPLIFLELDRFIEKNEKVHLLFFSFLIALLIITHNLSLVLFLPVLFFWVIFEVKKVVRNFLWLKLLGGGILTLAMSSFYILPLVFESKFVNLESTVQGYFSFRGHFASISELLISRFWGYGASLFQATDMSRSVGQIQWILPVISVVLLLYFSIVRKVRFPLFAIRYSLFAFLMGWFCLFLTHNKSTFIWEVIPFLAYVQFPWRFLGVAVFCFALVSGSLVLAFTPVGWMCSRKVITIMTVIIVIILNFSFFREDIWLNVSDKEIFSGKNWKEMQTASIGDFWPQFGGQIPTGPAPTADEFGSVIYKNSYRVIFELAKPTEGRIEIPVNYFPGWQAYYDNKPLVTSYTRNGLISVKVGKDASKIQLFFENTLIRRLGNLLSFAGIIIFGYLFLKINRDNYNL